MESLGLVQKIAVWVLPVLLAITVHEVAHGWVARYFGDPTAMQQGRLTLNPLRHIDPFGTVLVPALTLFLGGFVFGWARPVPVNFGRLRSPKRDMVYVALAGPMANLGMAVLWVLALRLGLGLGDSLAWLAVPLVLMGTAGVFINAILMILNLLPIPPLDGGRVLTGLLPTHLAVRYARIEPYGLVILVALLALGLLGRLIGPVIFLFLGGLTTVFGVPSGVLDKLLFILTN